MARTVALTVLALVAFAGNSILCRAALAPVEGATRIDAASFASIRIASGALILAPALMRRGSEAKLSPWAPVWLAVYVLGFSFSYRSISTGVGALLLFGLVQITMIGAGWLQGERLGRVRALGAATAFGGIVTLVTPSLGGGDSIDPLGAALMAMAGIAWGAYSLLGRGASDPLRMTAQNFALCLPIVLVFLPFTERSLPLDGVLLACASGAITSGLGYAVWYAALRGHSAMSAAVTQLAVPVLAALGGLAIPGDPVTTRLIIASALVLGGVAVASWAQAQARRAR